MKKNRPKYKQIIDAAIIVIAKNGYHASQVSKIASEASVADGTIYLYFKNKEDILVSVFEEKMGQFIKKTAQSIVKKESASDKLLELINMHFHQLSDDENLAVVTQLELRQSKKDLRLKINQVLKPYLNLIDQIIEEGMEEGLYKSGLNLPLVRQMIFGTLDETVTTWVMKDHKYDLTSKASTVHELLTNGIAKKS